jgi:hypothetical protein
MLEHQWGAANVAHSAANGPDENDDWRLRVFIGSRREDKAAMTPSGWLAMQGKH